MTVESIHQELHTAGFTAHTPDLTSGYRVYEQNGRIRIDWVLTTHTRIYGGTPAQLRGRTQRQLEKINKHLALNGYTPTLFVPDTGLRHFALTLPLPDATEDTPEESCEVDGHDYDTDPEDIMLHACMRRGCRDWYRDEH